MAKIHSQPELACGRRESLNGRGACKGVEVSRPKPHAGYGHRRQGIVCSSLRRKVNVFRATLQVLLLVGKC